MFDLGVPKSEVPESKAFCIGGLLFHTFLIPTHLSSILSVLDWKFIE